MEITRRLSKTANLPNPNYYAEALGGEFAEWALDMERAVANKGQWRALQFKADEKEFLDLEIGTGNGYFFAHQARKHPDRYLVGLEIKFKPLIQSIRRALNAGARNAKIARYHATDIDHLFTAEEINDVYIHHPDPWPKRKQNKNRLINTEFLQKLWQIQRPQSILEFKTDDEDYFNWAMRYFVESPYEEVFSSRDLHNSKWAANNFVTHFEKIFLRKGQPIFYARLMKV